MRRTEPFKSSGHNKMEMQKMRGESCVPSTDLNSFDEDTLLMLGREKTDLNT